MRKIRNPKSEIRKRIKAGAVGSFRVLLYVCALLLGAVPLLAQTNSGLVEQIPELRPVRGEVPPSYWEQNRRWIFPTGAGVIVAGAFVVWFLSRPKDLVVLSAEARARAELERLRGKAEDGAVLSRVSQVLRHYFAAAFGLQEGELNTTEFCSAIAAEERVGKELADDVAKFLRRCDERKFSMHTPMEPGDAVAAALNLMPSPREAVATALNLIDSAEARLKSLPEAEARSAARK